MFPFAHKFFPPIFDMGNDFEERKSNLFSIRKFMDIKIPFQQIQPLVYNICVYLNFNYRNTEVYIYLEGGGTFTRRRGIACWEMSKDLRETIHHLIPLLREVFLNQWFERISYPIIFLFSFHERFLGCARDFVLKRNKLETQLFVLRPCWGHALRR